MRPNAPPSGFEGTAVAGRYRLETELGSGAFGLVFRARDLLTDDIVAVKLLRDEGSGNDRSFSREMAYLRLLRLPGVVHSLDDGIDEALGPFLVTELVEGLPFPGRRTPCSWDTIRDTTVALLETLGRVHDLGVHHLDLKPANVLVQSDGSPVVLDFGIAGDTAAAAHANASGTPAYMAPEQVLGRRVDHRTDLYSVGAMLFETLSGQRSSTGDRTVAVLESKLHEPPPPLLSLVPDAPPDVAAVVDSLLERQPRQRPASAWDVLARLKRPRARGPAFRLDDGGALERAAAILMAGRDVAVFGEPGSGRTRLLADLAAKLTDCGATATVFEADDPEGERLVATFDRSDAHERPTLTAVARIVDRPDGADVVLGRLTDRALSALFHGPEHVWRLPTDAAHELHRRTNGLASQVADELDAWVRSGLCFWDDGRLRIDRATIDRLRSVLPALAPTRRRAFEVPIDGGTLPTSLDVAAAPHERAALGDHVGRARLALNAADDALEAGDETIALSYCEHALVLARPTGDDALEADALRMLAIAALRSFSPRSTDLALYHVERARAFDDELERLARLIRLVRDQRMRPTRATTRAAIALGSFDDDGLEGHRLGILLRGAQVDEGELGARCAEEIMSWAQRGDFRRVARVLDWSGLLVYRQLDFDEAARRHLYAAELTSDLRIRCISLSNATLALLDGYRLDEAIATAPRAIEGARAVNQRHIELTTIHMLAQAEYRSGMVAELSDESLEAAMMAGQTAHSVAVLTAAASDWRLGNLERAAKRALDAIPPFRGRGMPDCAELCRALAQVCGEPLTDADRLDIAAVARASSIPGVRIQALGLLAMAPGTTRRDWLEVALSSAAVLPPHTHRFPREVISVDEAIAALRAAI